MKITDVYRTRGGQRLYSVLLSEPELRLFGESTLGKLDRKSTQFQAGLSDKWYDLNNKMVDKIGLGNTKLGRSMKELNESRRRRTQDWSQSGLKARSELYGYKK